MTMFRQILKFGVLAAFVIFIGTGFVLVALLNVSIPGVKEANSDEERILHIARYVAHTYDKKAPGSQYYGMFYSQRLPSVFRLPVGLLETLTHALDCDSMVRSVVYLAAREEIEARQSDIFAGTFVHSVAEVKINNRWVLVDPYLGVVFRRPDGTLAEFESIKVQYTELKQEGLRAEGRVAASAKYYYGNLSTAVLSQSGTAVEIPFKIGALELPKVIGSIDSSNEDVIAELVAGAMGPIVGFLGPRLGSGKHTRVMLAEKPKNIVIEITFELTDKSKTPPSVISTPQDSCTPRLGALKCVVPAGVSEIVIRHGDWHSVFSVDQILIQAQINEAYSRLRQHHI